MVIDTLHLIILMLYAPALDVSGPGEQRRSMSTHYLMRRIFKMIGVMFLILGCVAVWSVVTGFYRHAIVCAAYAALLVILYYVAENFND